MYDDGGFRLVMNFKMGKLYTNERYCFKNCVLKCGTIDPSGIVKCLTVVDITLDPNNSVRCEPDTGAQSSYHCVRGCSLFTTTDSSLVGVGVVRVYNCFVIIKIELDQRGLLCGGAITLVHPPLKVEFKGFLWQQMDILCI